MARARGIKPGFFSNDALAELPFEFRLLFIGLWTVADKRGRLLDRPKKIRMEIFPGDDVDCDLGLKMLAKAGFIIRYEAAGVPCIQILNWEKHQNPHIKEAESSIPAIPALAPENPEQAVDFPERARLIPSSLIPDSGLLTVGNASAHIDLVPRETVSVQEFADWLKSRWPACGPKANFVQAARSASGLVGSAKVTQEVLRARIEGYRAWCDGGGVSGPQYVALPQNWMNPNHPDLPAHGWAVDWKAPPTKADQKLDATINAGLAFLRNSGAAQ